MFEARRAAEEGGKEIDMVVNIGRVLSGKWEYVANEIAAVNKAVVEKGAILKVIFENDCEYFRTSDVRWLGTNDSRSYGQRNHQTLRDL